MSTRGSLLRSLAHSIALWTLLLECMVFSLVPVPHNSPVNNTLELEIHHPWPDCPDGYFAAAGNVPACTLCSECGVGEVKVHECTSEQNTVCRCPDGLLYSDERKSCTYPVALSASSLPNYRELTTRAVKMQSNDAPDDVKAKHATKPDWTDFYILTVSSTAVLFFTLSLVLLFLMAVMKARSWYLYRRLPGSGMTLCFRGWLTRFCRRILPRQDDSSMDPIEVIASMHELNVRKEADPDQLKNGEIVEYLNEMNAVICCSDLHFTFPERKTYISSCITSDPDVVETRRKWSSPNLVQQACHKTVNVVLGHHSHKCCRHRNMLILTSNQGCDLGYFEAATMEVQERSEFAPDERSSVGDDCQPEDSTPCQHEQSPGVDPADILLLYTEIARPFKESYDLRFNGSLKLYLRRNSSHRGNVKDKVELKYRRDCGMLGDHGLLEDHGMLEDPGMLEDHGMLEDSGMLGDSDRADRGMLAEQDRGGRRVLGKQDRKARGMLEDNRMLGEPEEREALLENGKTEVPNSYSDRGCNTDERPHMEEAASESSVEVVVEVHGDDDDDERKTVAVTSV